MTVNLELATKHLLELFKETGEKTLLARRAHNLFVSNLKNNNLSAEARARNEEMVNHHSAIAGDSYHVHCELNFVLRHCLGVGQEELETIVSNLNEKFKDLKDT